MTTSVTYLIIVSATHDVLCCPVTSVQPQASLKHILVGWKNRRYAWKRNQVLMFLASTLEQEMASTNVTPQIAQTTILLLFSLIWKWKKQWTITSWLMVNELTCTAYVSLNQGLTFPSKIQLTTCGHIHSSVPSPAFIVELTFPRGEAMD